MHNHSDRCGDRSERHGRHRGMRGGPGGPLWGKMEKLAAMGRGGFGGGWGGGFGWDDFGGGFGGGGRKGRRGRMFAGGELRLVLLSLVADQPRHGYELMKALEELTGGNYSPSPGTLYPTLSLLSDEGMIAESADGDGNRKAFEATDTGRAELAERAEEVEALLKRLAELGDAGERQHSPELMRALMNFGGVLKHRVFAGKPDKETMQAIVDIIDEAAKRIERA
ncbi:PadR family transcriptional regulator [Erythrobacter sp. SG61-1L]|uniref:PadR family transcriptional regulator n=1 Tax=Erythrobacter sp. SG61-1L TaxID=1603897 RepID=UPI000A828C15|nr:PadR family transcriptional regulator [Erythrobacter sp. SG61-1L]